MGKDNPTDDLNAWTETGKTEWEFRVNCRFGDMSSAEVLKQLRQFCYRELVSNHALSPYEIKRIHGYLNISPVVTDEEILKQTDYFCIVVGRHASVHIDGPVSLRAKDFRDEVLKPVELVRESLRKDRFRNEFSQSDGVLGVAELIEIESALADFLPKARRHVDLISTYKKKGKNEGSDLKLFHVQTADMLMEYLAPYDEPRRKTISGGGWFLEFVRLIAKPIFKPNDSSKSDGFPRATRQFVDSWKRNEEIQLAQIATQEK